MKTIKKKGLAVFAMVAMMGFTTSVFAQVPQQGQEEMGTEYPQEQQQQTLPEDEQEHLRPQEEGLNEGLNQEEGITPQEQSQVGEVDYSEKVEESELPATISTALEERYPNHEVDKIFRGDDNSYKVKVKSGDEKKVVYFDEGGSFLKEEEGKDKEKDSDSSTDKW